MLAGCIPAFAAPTPHVAGNAKQGPFAPENFRSEPSGFYTTGVNRLVVHAVQDATMLRYIARTLEFLKWSKA